MQPTAALQDPTDAIGRRIGAALLDDLITWLFLPLALILVAPHAWDRVDQPSAQAATERCDRFNGTGAFDGYDEATGTYAPTPTLTQDGHSNANGFCVPVGDGAYYVEPSGLVRAILLLNLLLLVPGFLNQVLLQTFTGASVGKHAVGLRVVRPDGTYAGFWREVVRWLTLRVEAGLIALVLICVTKGHRRVGDMLADTFVVRRAAAGSPILIPGLTAPAPYPAYAPPPHPQYPPGAYPPGPYPPGAYPPGSYPPPAYPPPPAPPAAQPGPGDGPHWSP